MRLALINTQGCHTCMWEFFSSSCNHHPLWLSFTAQLLSIHTHFSLKRAGSSYLGPAMSAHPYTNSEPQLQPTYQEDVKTSFDDLVDPYATSFSPISRHQTYTVGTPLNQQIRQSHHKAPSIPPSTKAHSSKQSEDQSTLYNYPPLPQEKVETQSLWQRVQVCQINSRNSLLTVVRSLFQNRFRAVYISPQSYWKQR